MTTYHPGPLTDKDVRPGPRTARNRPPAGSQGSGGRSGRGGAARQGAAAPEPGAPIQATSSHPSPRGRQGQNLDLALAVVASLGAAFVVALDLPMAVRLPVGLAMTLAVPGYVASMVLFPPGELRGAERAALAFSLSLSLAVVAAPVLNALPGGVTPAALVVTVTTFTIVAAFLAQSRRRQALRAAGTVSVSMAHPASSRLSRRHVVAAGAVILVIGLAATLGSAAPAAVSSTEFFIVPPIGEGASLPKQVTAGAPTTIQLGVTNRESVDREFRVAVLSGSTQLAPERSFTVKSGVTWHGLTTFALSPPGSHQVVRFLLFQGPETEPFRLLSLELDVVAP